MTDGSTRYDRAGHGVELTSDRSANKATALQGYPLEVAADGVWPGLAGSATVDLRSDQVQVIADWLDTQAGSARSLPDLLTAATAVSYGPQSWQEAKNLQAAGAEVSAAVTRYLGLLVGNLQAASGTLSTVQQTYTTTERANTDLMRGTGSGMGEDTGGPFPM